MRFPVIVIVIVIVCVLVLVLVRWSFWLRYVRFFSEPNLLEERYLAVGWWCLGRLSDRLLLASSPSSPLRRADKPFRPPAQSRPLGVSKIESAVAARIFVQQPLRSQVACNVR